MGGGVAASGVLLAILAGPETAPPEAFTDENVARILALAS